CQTSGLMRQTWSLTRRSARVSLDSLIPAEVPMPWPQSQDHNEAIQSPASNFADPDLKRGVAVVNTLGLPMPFSGNFPDVYEVCGPDGSRWAVKCFTRGDPEALKRRYAEIDRHLQQARLRFSVGFRYLDEGIRVRGQWHP